MCKLFFLRFCFHLLPSFLQFNFLQYSFKWLLQNIIIRLKCSSEFLAGCLSREPVWVFCVEFRNICKTLHDLSPNLLQRNFQQNIMEQTLFWAICSLIQIFEWSLNYWWDYPIVERKIDWLLEENSSLSVNRFPKYFFWKKK